MAWAMARTPTARRAVSASQPRSAEETAPAVNKKQRPQAQAEPQTQGGVQGKRQERRATAAKAPKGKPNDKDKKLPAAETSSAKESTAPAAEEAAPVAKKKQKPKAQAAPKAEGGVQKKPQKTRAKAAAPKQKLSVKYAYAKQTKLKPLYKLLEQGKVTFLYRPQGDALGDNLSLIMLLEPVLAHSGTKRLLLEKAPPVQGTRLFLQPTNKLVGTIKAMGSGSMPPGYVPVAKGRYVFGIDWDKSDDCVEFGYLLETIMKPEVVQQMLLCTSQGQVAAQRNLGPYNKKLVTYAVTFTAMKDGENLRAKSKRTSIRPEWATVMQDVEKLNIVGTRLILSESCSQTITAVLRGSSKGHSGYVWKGTGRHGEYGLKGLY